MKKISLIALFLSFAFSLFSHDLFAVDTKDPKIKVDAVASTAVGNLFLPEAIVPAETGNTFVFIANASRGLVTAPPTTAWLVKRNPATGVWSRPVRLFAKGLCTSIAFGNADKWLVASVDYPTLASYQNILYAFTDSELIGELRGYTHRIEIIDTRTRKKLMSFSSEDFGLEKTEILKHPRVSPDAKWLTFYTHNIDEQRGIYLYNFETGKTYHLAPSYDKHPTWTPDGTKILFHYQSGGATFSDEGGDLEEARIGYFDLKFDGSEVSWRRVMMDPLNGPNVYHKHPSMYAGSDLVFFHKKARKIEKKTDEEALSHSMLYVRRVGVNTPVYKVTGIRKEDSVEMKAMKHIGSAAHQSSRSGLYFVGRPEDDKVTKQKAEFKVYHLQDNDVQKIAAEIARIEHVR